MNNTVIIIMLVVIVLIDIVLGVLVYLQYKNVKTCESLESTKCPSYYCPYEDPDLQCGNVPYRLAADGKTKICQEYLITQGVPVVKNAPPSS